MQFISKYSLYFYAALIIAAGWVALKNITPARAPADQYQPAKTAPQVVAIPKIIIQPKAVKVYAPIAKKALGLPPTMQSDPNLYALSAVKIKPGLHPQTIVTTLNASTGETETVVRRDPLPWLAIEQTGELRLDYGFKGGNKIVRLSAREDLLQVKALHAGINASIDSDGQLFVGAGVAWRW